MKVVKSSVLRVALVLAGILLMYPAMQFATAEVPRQAQAEHNRQDWEDFSRNWREEQSSIPVRPERPEPPAPVVPAPRYNQNTPIRRETPWSPRHLTGEDSERAEITNLLRICTCESEGSGKDCLGIWQVLRNIRSRTCDRERIPRISECDENGETMLSVMRRAQRFATGAAPTTRARQRWISRMELSCDMPEGFSPGARVWENQHRQLCEATRSLAARLVRGDKQRLTPARIIAWGGRCEDRRGACDDHFACARGLVRAETPTANAFWRRGGAEEEEPICAKYRDGG